EYALIKYRVFVEVEYFISLCRSGIQQLAHFDGSLNEKLRAIHQQFSLEDAQWIKEKEKETNHDVKAVEYFLKDKFEALGLTDSLEFIHFGLTSQDINNTAIPYSWKEATTRIYLPALESLISTLDDLALEWAEVPMLARTHGQPASPTRLGKEIRVFTERLTHQLTSLKSIPYAAKFGGATGNFNAHKVAYPDQDWVAFGNAFVNETLGLHRSQTTTQIEHYD